MMLVDSLVLFGAFSLAETASFLDFPKRGCRVVETDDLKTCNGAFIYRLLVFIGDSHAVASNRLLVLFVVGAYGNGSVSAAAF